MIDVYIINIDTVQDIELKMSSYRSNRLNLYKRESDKLRSKAATYLIDVGLQKYGLNECDMVYDVNIHGKPYFKNRPDIHFNISHSGKYVACAFSDIQIGVDIQIKEKANTDIAKRFFSEKNYRFIEESNSPEDTFIRLWTLKESYLKCIGRGLSGKFSNLRLRFDKDKAYVLDKGEIFTFTEIDNLHYRLSVCCCYEEPTVNIKFVT